MCGPALGILGSLLAPDALMDAGLLPEEVSVEADAAPYRLRLIIYQVGSMLILCTSWHTKLPCRAIACECVTNQEFYAFPS